MSAVRPWPYRRALVLHDAHAVRGGPDAADVLIELLSDPAPAIRAAAGGYRVEEHLASMAGWVRSTLSASTQRNGSIGRRSRRVSTACRLRCGRVVALGQFRESVTGDVEPRTVLILVEWDSKDAFDSYRNDPELADLHAVVVDQGLQRARVVGGEIGSHVFACHVVGQNALQRADRVKAELLSLGIAPERVRSAGRGERELLVPTDDGVEEPRNRRVEVNVR